MNYTLSENDGMQVLDVSDLNLEMENRKILQAVDEKILDGQTNFVINMASLNFINSMGLNFLISVLTRSRNAGGETVLINISEQANELLIITKLKSVISSCDSLEDAKAIFQNQADLS